MVLTMFLVLRSAEEEQRMPLIERFIIDRDYSDELRRWGSRNWGIDGCPELEAPT